MPSVLLREASPVKLSLLHAGKYTVPFPKEEINSGGSANFAYTEIKKCAMFSKSNIGAISRLCEKQRTKFCFCNFCMVPATDGISKAPLPYFFFNLL